MDKGNFHHALKIREDLCTGCSRCMNACPTEAIRVRNGKATLIADKCIDCGECFRTCPVDAIIIDHDDFNHIFDYKYRIALVPSIFTGQFPVEISLRQIHSVILDLGFTHVYEVENGVEILIDAIKEYSKEHQDNKPLISSFCPAVVRLIQVKFPALVDNIVLLKPPLDISAHFLKKEFLDKGIPDDEIGIFYVTPCAAKIAAIKDPVGEQTSPINGAINMDFLFNKVYHQVKQKNNQSCTWTAPICLPQEARNWSLTNGEARQMNGRCLAIDEIHNVIDFLEKLENDEIPDIDYLELRACDQSCAGGVLTTSNRFLTAERLSNHIYSSKEKSLEKEHPDSFRPISSQFEYLKDKIKLDSVKPRSMMKLDENMAEAMRKMDKGNQIMKVLPMIDCSVCGAPNCHAFALDIVQGNAQLKQCVFIQKILEQKGELTLAESIQILRGTWGFEKTNKYMNIDHEDKRTS